MKVYSIKREVILKGSLEGVWEFFATPLNLNEITPRGLHFDILTDLRNKQMYAGMIIEYKVRPFLRIPMYWVTEITHCDQPTMFVDEQRFGPYAFWHHKHHFKAISKEEVLMIDEVHYAIGWGILGKIAHALFVKAKLKEIFDYRSEIIAHLFNNKTERRVA